MVARQRVAPFPIDLTVHARTRCWRLTLEAVHHLRSRLADLDDGARAAVPTQRSDVVRLSATCWVKRGAIQHDTAFACDLNAGRIERADVRVGGVQQLGLSHAQMVAICSARTCCLTAEIG